MHGTGTCGRTKKMTDGLKSTEKSLITFMHGRNNMHTIHVQVKVFNIQKIIGYCFHFLKINKVHYMTNEEAATVCYFTIRPSLSHHPPPPPFFHPLHHSVPTHSIPLDSYRKGKWMTDCNCDYLHNTLLIISVKFLSDCLTGYLAVSHWNLVTKFDKSSVTKNQDYCTAITCHYFATIMMIMTRTMTTTMTIRT